MIEAIATLESASAYGQGKCIQVPKEPKESHEDYENRTWRERAHYDPETKRVFIPGMAFKNCIREAAEYLALKIKGKGNQTWKKHFEAGIPIADDLVLPETVDQMLKQTVFVPSDGIRGSGKRVIKHFPHVASWSGDVRYLIADETITEDIFREHLEAAGAFVGLGYWRVRRGGMWGRFSVEKLKWTKM